MWSSSRTPSCLSAECESIIMSLGPKPCYLARPQWYHSNSGMWPSGKAPGFGPGIRGENCQWQFARPEARRGWAATRAEAGPTNFPEENIGGSNPSEHLQYNSIQCTTSGSMGCGQVVRHQVLVLAFGGSNPSIPARSSVLNPSILAMKIVRPFGLAIFITLHISNRWVQSSSTCPNSDLI